MDDAFDKVGRGCGAFLGCIFGCGILAGVVTLTVYLGIYGFGNPDHDCWYGVYASKDGGWPTQGLFQSSQEEL